MFRFVDGVWTRFHPTKTKDGRHFVDGVSWMAFRGWVSWMRFVKAFRGGISWRHFVDGVSWTAFRERSTKTKDGSNQDQDKRKIERERVVNNPVRLLVTSMEKGISITLHDYEKDKLKFLVDNGKFTKDKIHTLESDLVNSTPATTCLFFESTFKPDCTKGERIGKSLATKCSQLIEKKKKSHSGQAIPFRSDK